MQANLGRLLGPVATLSIFWQPKDHLQALSA